MSPWWIAAAATAGLAAGPAQRATVFATAVPAGQSRRQQCRDCGQPALAGWRQLFSPAWVTDRCSHCGSRLALPPLAPELVTAGVVALLAMRARSVPELAALCILAAGGIALACIDIGVRRLPDLLTLPLYLGLIGLLVIAAGTGHQWGGLLRAVLAGVALACFYLALLLVTPAGVGPGDAKLALTVGTMLGWYGWPELYVGTLCAFLAGGAYAMALLTLHRASRQDSFPFGPFMIAGAFLIILASPL
jgi:leader peptidase (prepilin peptidase) / N-methyltransferase